MSTIQACTCSKNDQEYSTRMYWSHVLSAYADQYLEDVDPGGDSDAYVYAQGIKDAAVMLDPEWNIDPQSPLGLQGQLCLLCHVEEPVNV